MPEMKKPTWNELISVIEHNIVHRYLSSTPPKWQGAMALALSVAKWLPRRGQGAGEGACGLCAQYDTGECSLCPLNVATGKECYASKSLHDVWISALTKRTKKSAALAMYKVLLELYTKEYYS